MDLSRQDYRDIVITNDGSAGGPIEALHFSAQDTLHIVGDLLGGCLAAFCLESEEGFYVSKTGETAP